MQTHKKLIQADETQHTDMVHIRQIFFVFEGYMYKRWGDGVCVWVGVYVCLGIVRTVHAAMKNADQQERRCWRHVSV